MVKKPKQDIPSVTATPSRDIIQRLNFLYQASVYLQSIPSPSTPRPEAINEKSSDEVADSLTRSARRKTKAEKSRHKTDDLARSYIQSMRLISQKTMVKMDPSLKRSICSGCNTTLVPGVSTSIRVKSSTSHGRQMVYTCLFCKAAKRIPAPLTSPPSTAAVTDNLQSGSLHERSKSFHPKSATSRPLPLFARPDAGHVIFRGNDQVSQDEVGCTPFG